MSIRNKGTLIRLARKKANLTQEQLSEGICSVHVLSQIETGSLTVSSSYFEALMSRAGVSVSVYPCYKSRCDFDCFYTLKRARFFLNVWQLDKAYQELDFVEKQNWAENKFHYSEWTLLHGKLQLLSGCCNHQKNYEFLLKGLRLTHPSLNLLDFSSHLLSVIELEYLLLLAEEALYLNNMEESFTICSQIEKYLSQTYITYLVKERLLADNAYILGKYYILQKKYENAVSIIEPHRNNMAVNSEDLTLLRLTFLKGFADYCINKNDDSLKTLKTVLYSAHAIDSCYTTICFQYLKDTTNIEMESLFPLKLIPLVSYISKYGTAFTENGTETNVKHKYLSLGQIIKSLREEQNLSLEIVCQGLCCKSTLSKIEHNHLQPDIFLTEALLQRLGISERPFDFYGNKQEHDFYTLKFQSMNTQLLGNQVLTKITSELEKCTHEKNILQKQFLHFSKALLCDNPEEKIQVYLEALHYTLPDFDIARIHEYRLSWAELTILNNIARLFIYTNTPTKCFWYFNQLLSYYNTTQPDIILKKNVYIPLLQMYCYCFYNQKHYKDVLNCFDASQFDILKNNSNYYSFFLFYYCQSAGECKDFEQATLYGNYSCALSKLHCLDANATCLTRYLKEDFSIELIHF